GPKKAWNTKVDSTRKEQQSLRTQVAKLRTLPHECFSNNGYENETAFFVVHLLVSLTWILRLQLLRRMKQYYDNQVIFFWKRTFSTPPIEKLCSSTPTGGEQTFRSGSRVLVGDYRSEHRSWTVGSFLIRIGQVIYSVWVGQLVWKRPVNQIRQAECPISKVGEQSLDLNLLRKTFDNPRTAPTACCCTAQDRSSASTETPYRWNWW
ncbi:hypothetical protein CLF_106082, partial [Clonorchis sinensis]